MTRSAVAIRHVAFEDLGLLAPVLEAHGFTVAYVDIATHAGGLEAARDADLLVVLGGPIGVADVNAYPFLAAEAEVLHARFVASRPTLGICLGAQLLATATIGSVSPGATFEIGYGALELTDAGRESVLAPLEGVPVLHWHQDAIALPADHAPLAYTAACRTQAFVHGPMLGLQFHLEVDSRSLEHWLVAYAGDLTAHGIDPSTLRRQAARFGPDLALGAGRVLETWLAELGF